MSRTHERTLREPTLATDPVLSVLPSSRRWQRKTAGWPVKASPNGRYLTLQDGTPWLMMGDSPQPLLVNISTADAVTYFSNRQGHGINCLWSNLLCADYTFGRSDGTTYDGVKPFTSGSSPSDYDLATPNATYFNRMDTFINSAAAYGIVFLLDPIETGSWEVTIDNNGATKAYNYGAYLGNRYKTFKNIIWMSGNDFGNYEYPTEANLVADVMHGIADTAPHLQTIELMANANDNLRLTSLDCSQTATYTTLNAAYTYNITYDCVLHGYGQSPTMPVFLVEANYHGEQLFADTDTPIRNRKQIWWTATSGATGQMGAFSFDSYRLNTGWQSALDNSYVSEFGYAKAFLNSRPWYRLAPDTGHTFVTAGYGSYGTANSTITSSSYCTAALADDGSLGLVYVPAAATLTVDMTKMRGTTVARWYDPTTAATFSMAAGSPFANTGTQNFTKPGNNAGGDPDWVLVLEA